MSITREDGPLKWNLNTLVTLGGIAATIIVNIIMVTTIWANTSRDVLELKSQMSDVKLQIQNIVPLQFQLTQAVAGVAENKESIKTANARIDKITESINDKLDKVIVSVNSLTSTVAVINSKLGEGTNQKTSFTKPIFKY